MLLVLANGFFVATEFAIVAVRRGRLEQLANEGVANAAAAREVVRHLDTYIAACQLGVTMASLALGWIGEPALSGLVEPPLEALVGSFAHEAADAVAVGASFAVITALHIVIGELAPKGLALQRPEATTLWVARPLQVFELIFRWPVALLNGVGNGVLRLVGLQPAAGHEMVHSVEELRLLVTGSQQAGEVEASEARIATRAFVFADLTAGALMTPRTELEAVPVDAAPAELRTFLAETHHARLPVYEGSLDEVVGILHLRDFWRAVAHEPDGPDLRRLLRPPLFVPDTRAADDLLELMQSSRQQIAIVVDEFGGTAGIVTLEDLVEALVGPIAEELPLGESEAPAEVQMDPDGSVLLDGLTRLGEWEELTGLKLPPEDHEAVETLGGLVMARLGRIPQPGDEVALRGRVLRVEQLDGRRVSFVRMLPDRTASPEFSLP